MSTLSSFDRPPTAEIGKRTAEAGAGILAAAKAASLKDMVANQAAYRKRVAESYASQQAALRGELPPAVEADTGEEMGHIIITGDIYGNEAVKALEAMSKPPAPLPSPAEPPRVEPPAAKSAWQRAWPYILTAVLAAGGGTSLPWLAQWFAQRPAADTVTDVTIRAWKPSP